MAVARAPGCGGAQFGLDQVPAMTSAHSEARAPPTFRINLRFLASYYVHALLLAAIALLWLLHACLRD